MDLNKSKKKLKEAGTFCRVVGAIEACVGLFACIFVGVFMIFPNYVDDIDAGICEYFGPKMLLPGIIKFILGILVLRHIKNGKRILPIYILAIISAIVSAIMTIWILIDMIMLLGELGTLLLGPGIASVIFSIHIIVLIRKIKKNNMYQVAENTMAVE